MIQNVIIHMAGEQPLMADIRDLPTAGDACLLCTNLRLMGGKTPHFIDRSDSWFLIPLTQVRFVEIHAAALGEPPHPPPASEEDDELPGDEADLEMDLDMDLDTDFLKRIRDTG